MFITIILLVVKCRRETLSLTLREEQRLEVFENKMHRTKTGAKRLNYRRMENVPHLLYSSYKIIKNLKLK